MTPVGINGDGLIPFKKAGSDTVQLIHAKPAIESHKRGHGRQHLAAVTPMPPPMPPTQQATQDAAVPAAHVHHCRLYRRRIDKPAKLRPAPTQHALPASHVAIPHTKKVFTRIHDTI